MGTTSSVFEWDGMGGKFCVMFIKEIEYNRSECISIPIKAVWSPLMRWKWPSQEQIWREILHVPRFHVFPHCFRAMRRA